MTCSIPQLVAPSFPSQRKISSFAVAVLASLTCALGVASNTAQAGSELAALLDVLLENGTISSAQHHRLTAEINQDTKSPETLQESLVSPRKRDATPASNPRLSFKSKHKHENSSPDIGGRVEAHSAFYKDDGVNLGDGSEIRRARLNIKGKLDDHWAYKFEYDFVQGDTKGIKDAYIAYNSKPSTTWLAGSFRPFYSLEFQANSHANTFIERALPFAFAPGWRSGIGVKHSGNNWTAESGLFGGKVGQSKNTGDDELLFSGRFTWLPIKQESSLLHLGVSGLWIDSGDQNSLSFSNTPESKVTNVKLANTGLITGVNKQQQVGVEASWMLDRWNLQGEYMASHLNRDTQNLEFDGWYIQASRFFSNDQRRYKKGKFLPVKPNNPFSKGAWGAWQAAIRYSELDLNDQDIAGGALRQLSLALNMYATTEIRLSAEYITVLEAVLGAESEPDILQFRIEWVL